MFINTSASESVTLATLGVSVLWLCYFEATNKLRDDRCQLLDRLCTLATMSHSSRLNTFILSALLNFPSSYCNAILFACLSGAVYRDPLAVAFSFVYTFNWFLVLF